MTLSLPTESRSCLELKPFSPTLQTTTPPAQPARVERSALLLIQYRATPTTECRNRLVEHHIALVVSVARRIGGYNVPIDDLVADGCIGLIRAVEGFDPDRGVKFSTFAVKHIEGAIRTGSARSSSAIIIPSRVRTVAKHWLREQRQLEATTGEVPSETQIAMRMGLTGLVARRARDAARVFTASATDIDVVPLEGRGFGPGESDDGLGSDVDAEKLTSALETLDDKSRFLVRSSFGLGGCPRIPLARAARQIGLTYEAASRLMRQAMAVLRQTLEQPAAYAGSRTNRGQMTVAA